MTIKKFASTSMNENCYVLTSGGETVVIDPGEMSDALSYELENKNVKYILLTHGHFDHIAALPEIQKLTKAKVCIHALDADKLKDKNLSLAVALGANEQTPIAADILFSDGDNFPFGDTKITVMHTPGHSKGSCCFICDRHIFSGDTLFCLTYGRYDFYDGDIVELVNSLDRLMALDGDYIVHPGHNRDTTLDEERVQNRYVRLKKYIYDK